MNFLKIQKDKLDVTSIQDLVNDESCGATSIFVGTTRDNFDDKKVISLEYEAYEPMAIKTMEKICSNLRNKWPDLKHIAIYHRLGIVPVKEASVVIAISSPHRLDSLQSLQYAIDELKRTVPIWKKEKYDNETISGNHDNVFSRIKRLKKSKFNFNECNNIPNTNTSLSSLPKNFVQIGATEDELSRRIQCFIERKREENDLNNILDFIPSASATLSVLNSNGNDTNTEDTCARVNSLLAKRNDSKGHLKVYRVKNEYGPQTTKDYTNALDKLIKSPNQKGNSTNQTADVKPSFVPLGIAERLGKIENFLNLPMPVSKDVYQRLKIIENKIQYLETISPEYRHFIDLKKPIKEENIHKRKYTIQDIDNYISVFENKKQQQ